MNEPSPAAPDPTLPPELDAERMQDAGVGPSMSDQERMLVTGVAAELAALSDRTESASAEVAAIQVRMQGLVDELTATAGATCDTPSVKTTPDASA